jgi:hypothetical protein
MAQIQFVRSMIDRLRPVTPPSLRKPFRSLQEPVEHGLDFARGKVILRRYSAHYRKAKRLFRNTGHRPAPLVRAPSDVGVRIVMPGRSDNFIDLPEEYAALVRRISDSAAERFRYSESCLFVPAPSHAHLPLLTRDVLAIQNGEVFALRLADPYGIDGLAELCGSIVAQAERHIYGSYVLLDKVYIYRSPICRSTPRASWIWHYDNHPREVLKVMIYLTDVTPASAPFEYLRSSVSGEPIRGRPLAPLYRESRVPAATVEHLMRNGAEGRSVTGPAGSMVVFDNNVIHRAHLASECHRDALVLQLRPATCDAVPRLDRRWTGSFQDIDFNTNPDDLAPQPREAP